MISLPSSKDGVFLNRGMRAMGCRLDSIFPANTNQLISATTHIRNNKTMMNEVMSETLTLFDYLVLSIELREQGTIFRTEQQTFSLHWKQQRVFLRCVLNGRSFFLRDANKKPKDHILNFLSRLAVHKLIVRRRMLEKAKADVEMAFRLSERYKTSILYAADSPPLAVQREKAGLDKLEKERIAVMKERADALEADPFD